MITLYTANTPNGQKITIALEEMGRDYQVRHVDLSAGEQHQPQFLAISPNNKIPVIVDDSVDAGGNAIFESGAILVALAEQSGQLLPDAPWQRSEVLQWLFMQVGSVGPMLGQLWWFRHGTTGANPQALERYTKETQRIYGVIERRLADSRFIGGATYSIADIAMFPWLRTWDELGLAISSYPHVRDWLTLMEARPAVQRGLVASRP